MNLRDRLIDPRSPDKQPRRAAYALPTLFTAANVFLGFYALLEVFQGAIQMATDVGSASLHFKFAAMAIGAAVFFDGLDGRIARMTNTVSDFGREMDSLADVITFGIAPAALAFAWGVFFVPSIDFFTLEQLRRTGYFLAFVFLLCGAARLARFNIQKNPVPKNPGRPDRKYFVGLPIPAAAGALASIVYAAEGVPLNWWMLSAAWLTLVGLLAFLMVSTWRYPSFKDLSLLRPRSPVVFVLVGSLIYLIWNFSQPVLLGLSVCYVGSGILIRAGGIVRRRIRPAPPREPEHQVG
ncbi:MAG TPA: CDP-diacylglycerol--serine O-phosphatidyltransferase [Bryobacteraceae bacterium]|jgi:CDP-diacylglycerol--serine O-phosphatidyltransferase|nr:CDP-diacylglycerol--serine O-phosphatidyltransferase [Bryobacteraceae bacterium]